MTEIFRTLAATLALGAMLLRAVLPVGWMPNATGAGGPALVICSVDGLHHVARGAPRDPAHDGQDEHGFVCPFAAVAHLAPPQAPVAIPAPETMARLSPPTLDPAAAFTRRDSVHAPRGPPRPV